MGLDISGLAAVIMAIITLYKVYKTSTKEAKVLDAEAIDKYAQASYKTAEHNNQLYTRIDTLEHKLEETVQKLDTTEEKVSGLETVIESLRKKLRKRDALLAEWEHGIHMILEQLCDANIVPKWNPPRLLADFLKDDEADG